MKYPICIQNEEKINSMIEKYIQDEEKFKYHLGIHYSTFSYIYYYLMRQQPYSNLMIKLQNYQQETPNRMFIGINDTISVLESGKDPREIIPELYSSIEYLINLNCDYFGIKANKIIVDDVLINFFKVNENTNPFFKYINFIIEHRKLLNSKFISLILNEWIDNVFGINQLPTKKKDRENCCNIFMKACYEQELNLQEKLNKYLDKIKNYKNDENNNPTDLFKLKIKYIKKLSSKMNLMISFGQTPYQVFKEKHFKKEINDLNEYNYIENEGQDNNIDNDDMLNKLYKMITTLNVSNEMKQKDNYLYFEINPVLNKIFVLSEKRILEIKNTKLFSKEGASQYSFSFHDSIQLPHILYNDKIKNEFGEDYYIYKIKYALSSFDDIEEDNNYNNINTKDLFHTYGRDIIENIIINKEKDKNIDKNKKNEINENSYYKFITCRYIDKSFKIHRFLKDKNNKNKNMDIYKPFSFICEDYVCSCCTISFCQFLIGLKNGKLIQFYIEKQEKHEKQENNNVKSKENTELFQIKMEKYIQAHKGKINLIEINKRLGLIITGGDDNYILIRKLYDFELLSPIKIKKKYIITMAKISPLNFIYILCYHKEKKKSVIFGYTLTGLKFAKSNYGFYDNIDFTISGNIITLNNNNELLILSGSKLAYLKMNLYDPNFDDFNNINDKIQNSIWLTFNYFRRESDTHHNYNKIITYYKKGDNKLATINVSGNKYFD